MDLTISNVLRKKYQSNWRKILSKVISKQTCTDIMMKVQGVLAIAENENEQMNQQIVDFVNKCGEICMMMMISDPPLVFDCRQIG